MATFKAEVLPHHRKQDGTYNVKIRVIHKQKKRYLATQLYVTKEDLTRSMKLKNQFIIDEVEKIIASFRKTCNKYSTIISDFNVDQVVDLINQEDGSGEKFDLDFIGYARDFISRIDNAGNAYIYSVSLNNLIKFIGREKISIFEITTKFVKDWIQWIKEQPAPKNKKKGSRAASLYPSQIRAIYNSAKNEYNDEGGGVIRIPYSPFKNADIPKYRASRKRTLTADEVRNIASIPYRTIIQPGTNRFNFSRDVFLLSFCLLGMNEVDLYNCTDYRNGRITYKRQKTKNRRDDEALISVKVEPEIIPLITKYRDKSGKRVFNFYEKYSSVASFTTSINKGLKIIGKQLNIDDLEFYAARHSLATIAINDVGADKYSVHTALNHVDEKMRVTDIYVKKSFAPNDRVNRRLLNYIKLDLSNTDEQVSDNMKKSLALKHPSAAKNQPLG